MGSNAGGVLRRIATELSAPLWQLGQDFHIEAKGSDRFLYRGTSQVVDDLLCGLAGRHQWDNAACALARLEAADRAGIQTGQPAARAGLGTVSWEGRLESIEADPKVLLDGAHNPPAAKVLSQYLMEYASSHPTSRILLVWGMMRDKDHRGFIAPLLPLVSEIVLTQIALARSATVDELRIALDAWPGPVLEAVFPMDALTLAKGRCTAHDLICIAGSLMLVGEVKAAVRGCGLSPIRG
jgi:dihydrofolate synthase/folylpolyglutamate synthase